jgi:NAD(P)H-hydrate epimerase
MLLMTQAQMRRIDEYMIHTLKIPGVVLMENAALGVIGRILKEFPKERPRAFVFCGVGNNGGDGFAVARGLLARGFDARTVLLGDPALLKGDALVNYDILASIDGKVLAVHDEDKIDDALYDDEGIGIVVDAIFGTGLAREVSGLQLAAVRKINSMDAFCVSVDIPSGVSGDTGAVMGDAVHADATVTFQYAKAGHYLYPGKEYTGDLTITEIGLDEGCPVLDEAVIHAYDSMTTELMMERRRADTNKGDYGRLMIIAGSVGMAGAAVLSTRAAIRTGTGLTTLGSVDYVVSVVQKTVPEATCKILSGEMDTLTRNAMYEADRYMKDKTALAVGPGITENGETQDLVEHMVATHDIVKIFDADALNVIARNTDILFEKTGSIVLTPHPKEFSRLTGHPVADILRDPIGAARNFVQKYDVVLVLKGSTSVIADSRGRITLIAAGSPGMAKGGSGDVLTGVIASLAAQGKDSYDAAVLGVMIAGMAGEITAREMGEYSMTAGDTIERIGQAIKLLSQNKPAAQKPGCKKTLLEKRPEDTDDDVSGSEANGPQEEYENPDDETFVYDEENDTGAKQIERVHGPELFLQQDDSLSFTHPQKTDSQKPPYTRRKIVPKK